MTVSSMSNIGDRLKKARESKSLTIDQIQKQTRIHSSVLLALEEGRCDKMLTPTYVKSFLKKYSAHLGLDAKGLLDEYLSIHPELRAQETPSVTQPKDPEAKRGGIDFMTAVNKGKPFIMAAALVLIFVTAVGGLVKFIAYHNRVRIVVAPKPATVKVARPKISADKVTQKIAATPKQSPPKEVPLPKESSPIPPPAVPRAQSLNLVLKAKRDVFVSAFADGERVFKKHLPKGKEENITAKDSINLYIAKGEALSLTLNGKPVSLKRGVIKDLFITRKGVQAR
ncbi:MAG: DUF4115 domain-containing protein [Candidatus Omnitrophica bacterium]|nr:DUF4115 domain-containing protein [Candidatus Omnitrophota bacterium]